MLVPEFYFRGWGGRRAGSGGMFGVPLGPSVMEWGGAGDTDPGAWAKSGCWVALRDLGSKLGSSLNSGLFGIQLQGQLFGTGMGAALWAVR